MLDLVWVIIQTFSNVKRTYFINAPVILKMKVDTYETTIYSKPSSSWCSPTTPIYLKSIVGFVPINLEGGLLEKGVCVGDRRENMFVIYKL